MKKKIIIIIILLLTVLLISLFLVLRTNKTFFKTTYIGVENQKIFIPKYSYFDNECCMTAAVFYSLKSEKQLKKEINNYMKDFKYFSDEHTYGYKKGDLFIQEYSVQDNFFYRTIVITY